MNKTISFYWGGGPLSYLQYLSVVSFRTHNPGWKIHLYMPKTSELILPTWETNEQSERYTGEDYLERAKALCDVKIIDFSEYGIENMHEVQKSDFIRWQILYQNGGVWSDMDILYIKPLTLDGFDTAMSYDGHHHLIGFFITKPQQKIFADIFNEAQSQVNSRGGGYQFLGSRMLKKMFADFHVIRQSYPESKIINVDVVYPYSSDAPDIQEMFFGSDDRTAEETIGIHWYNGSPIAKKYQNNPKFMDNQSVISKYIKELSCSL